MTTLGERLIYARKEAGFTQESLADTIGVSRGVIYNLENGKNKNKPQDVVLNAICQALKIRKEWLVDGSGEMSDDCETSQSSKILAELSAVASELSEDELLYLRDTVYALRNRLTRYRDLD